ncbi:MAG: Sporulation domain protein [Hydrocarboniphaga sp.]|uniref:SPOR domain-containing protein n=1 Tax=Hydrocarboniphaga sp. TaxID=2033016 RepID=UPI0026201B2E|nr:SPOR domain-containing protein [Hydrocarboniphaga sp.]MDB5967946.1 Sporulation domain protein [Hydrocarboniphaga sp.]
MKRFAEPALLTMLIALLPAVAGAQMLRLDSQQGSVELTRGKEHPLLKADTAILADDVIKVGADSSLSLHLGRHGILEMGPGSELEVERLPFASYADDLRTVLRLRRGFLRVIWKQPPLDISWPLFVYMDSDRASLATGEYFFELGTEINAICVAEGELALAGGGRDDAQLLQADTCYRLVAGIPPQPRDQQPDDWIAVREHLALDRGMWGAPKAAAPAVVAAAAPKVDKAAKPAPTTPNPAEKPAVVRAPPPETAVARAGAWTLNLASFPDQASADKELARLKKAGFPGVVQPADVKGRNWYRVQIQGLASKEEAQGMSGQLKAAGFMQAWIMKP